MDSFSMDNTMPPSPALSECDSLADIDDLDAFLNAQGPLSYFPTPGLNEMKKHDENHMQNLRSHGLLPPYETPLLSAPRDTPMPSTDQRISTSAPNTYNLIERLVFSSDLPDEVMAIAHLILDALLPQNLESIDATADLLIVSAVALAEIQVSDHPHRRLHWSRLATYHSSPLGYDITARQIDKTTTAILEALNWTIHSLCNPLAVREMMLSIQSRLRSINSNIVSTPEIKIEEVATALWINGQLTPASNSPTTIVRRPSYFASTA